ncbi:MAG: phosphatase PAP2 family protein [Proteobacteria bacterium]|nr:phosphatase PAP2 family protein [Pseudomonadota bacterium]
MRHQARLSVISLLLAAFAASVPARADTLTTYGDIARHAIPGIAVLISLDKKDQEGVAQLAATWVVSTGVTYSLKYTVDKRRPNGGRRSFPSGHMTNAMAGASYLHYRYGWKYGLPAYAAAAVVGIGRVQGNFHRWEDVVAGAAIANITAYIFTDTLDSTVIIIPVFDMKKKNFGILAGVRF